MVTTSDLDICLCVSVIIYVDHLVDHLTLPAITSTSHMRIAELECK